MERAWQHIRRCFSWNEPTRGIDVEAKQEIYRLIRKEAEEGIGVIMFSSDMMELDRFE